MAAFYQALKETGFVEGKNISIEFRRADGHYDRLTTLAAENYQTNRQVSGWILPPQVIRAFGAHCQNRTLALTI
jgi:putative tryptophan/tyrosine transport system substrate-binding protein